MTAALLMVVSAVLAAGPTVQAASRTPAPVPPGLEKIEHIIIIMQENRSFDHYFGTYESPSGEPVEGIPSKASGGFSVCVPHPALANKCVPPFRTNNPVNKGGPHAHPSSTVSVDGGKMDGFIKAAMSSRTAASYFCANHPLDKTCAPFNGPVGQPDLMSTMGRNTLPNYWAYADWGVLQDHMFGPTDSWSLPAHLFLYSGWSATCPGGPMSCTSSIQTHSPGPYKWTPITYMLDKAGVTWKNYVGEKTVVGCARWPCQATSVVDATPWIWNPLPNFSTVIANKQVNRTQPVSRFISDASEGTLPSVSWILPNLRNSEHPAHGSLQPGQSYVTKLVNAVGRGPEWGSTAIFISWDDWGGFYDHVVPPNVDVNGYGLRVPGLVISPYAKESYVDHQTLSFDAYLKFIEDRFLGGDRLPGSRPDSRPTVRESVARLGDLTLDFDFTQEPRPAPGLDASPRVPEPPEGVSEAVHPNAPF